MFSKESKKLAKLPVEFLILITLYRYQLEHNQISRSEVDKAQIFDLLNLHLDDPDAEIQHTALQLIQVGKSYDDDDDIRRLVHDKFA